MKRIVIEKDEQTVNLSEVEYIAYPAIGACHKASKEKAFVVMTEYDKRDTYKLMCVDGFERGNQYDSKEYIGTLDNIFKHPGYDFFLFNTPTELFGWLAK
jgi:hypothetical protein